MSMGGHTGLHAVHSKIQSIEQRIAQLNQKMTQLTTCGGPNFTTVMNQALRTNDPADSELSGDHAALIDMVEQQAVSQGVEPALVKAVVKAESGFKPDAVSGAGAKGLMQLMPSTAQSLGVQSILNPVDNVKGGTKYLKSLLEKYHSIPKALAAYNAGPGAVDRYGGIPPYAETQTYVNRVMAYRQQYQTQRVE